MSSDRGGETVGRTGTLIVISGPSGAGKTSICKALIEGGPNTEWSVSATTRPMRRGERNGQSYEFVSPEEFETRRAAGDFIESARYVGHDYGTPRRPVEAALARGRNVVLEIDVQGGIQVAAKMPDSIRVFVLPPDHASLRARLEGRNTEAKEQLAKRLDQADGEIAIARDSGCYQHFVVNDVLETSIEEIRRIIDRENERT